MLSFSYAFLATSFTTYQAFVYPGAIVEAQIDKGLMVEMIIGCSDGAGIITYSKAEGLYCTPDAACYSSVNAAVERLCR